MPRALTLALLPALALALGGCGGGDEPTTTGAGAGASTDTVTIQDFKYEPADVTVTAGTEVTWTNEDSAPHTATSDESGGYDTDTLKQDQDGSVTLDDPGTFSYHCEFHAFMKGTIKVE